MPTRRLLAALPVLMLPATVQAASLTYDTTATDTLDFSFGVGTASGTLDLVLPQADAALGDPLSATISLVATISFDGTWYGAGAGDPADPATMPEDTDGTLDLELYGYTNFYGDFGDVTTWGFEDCTTVVADFNSCSVPYTDSLTLDDSIVDTAPFVSATGETFPIYVDYSFSESAFRGRFEGQGTVTATASVAYDYENLPAVPLPAGLPLLLGGLAGLGLLRRAG